MPNGPIFTKFPVLFPDSRESSPETGSPWTGPSASYYVLDIAYVIVFLGSLFSREFAGFTGLVSKAFVAETVARAISAAAVMKISPAPFRG